MFFRPTQILVATLSALAAIPMSGSAVAQGRSVAMKPTSFQLYYGGDESLVASLKENINPQQLVVVDVRGLTALQFGQLRRSGHRGHGRHLHWKEGVGS